MNNTQLNSKNLNSSPFRASVLVAVAIVFAISAIFLKSASAQEVADCSSCIKKASSLFARGKIINASELMESWNGKCKDSAQFQLLRSTILARRHGFKKQATEAARLACQLDPNSKAAHLQLGMCLMSTGDSDGACIAFQNLVNVDPSSYEGWSALGQLYTQLGKHEESKTCAKKAACLEPESREAKLKVVKTLVQIEKFKEAKQELKRLILDDTLEPEFFILVSQMAQELGAFEEAINASDKVLSTYPNSIPTLKSKALAQLWLRRYKKCLMTTAKFKNIPTHAQQAYAIEALCQIKLGNRKQAKLASDKASKLNPDEKLALLSKGILLLREGNVSEALDIIHESLAKNDLFAPAHMELSKIYMKLGNDKRALQEAISLSRRPVHKASSYALEARILMSQNLDVESMTAAKRKLSKAFRLDDSNPDALIGKAEVNLKSGKIQTAKQLTDKALQVEPGNIDAILQMSKIKDLDGESKTALKLMDKAKELAPGQGDVIIARAEMYLNKGDANKAIKLLKASQKEASQFPPIDFRLAKLLNQSGDSKNAAKYFKNSLNKGLVGKNAKEARRQIKEIKALVTEND